MRYAITMDADMQHHVTDLPRFAESLHSHPGHLIIGTRQRIGNQPSGSSFANKLSDFWIHVETGKKIKDTQSGYRLYPLSRSLGLPTGISGYEAETAWLVRLLWHGTPVVQLPVEADYLPEGGHITHFRKGKDFIRISLLHTVLCIESLFVRPVNGLKRLFRRMS